jgi:hypothetical protein
MLSLQQTINRVREREGFPPPGVVSVRQLLSHFSLTPALSVRAFLASDLIAERYQLDGRSAGPLGIPMGNVRLTADGALQPFSGGYMGVKGNKTDPVTMFQAEVRFLGFRCNEESGHDQSTPSDEPYFVIGITGLRNSTKLFGPYENVDGGESRFTTSDNDVLVTDVQPPFTLSVVAMENDAGTPDEAAAKVEKACEDAIRVTQVLAVAFGQAQVAAVTVALNTIFSTVGGFLADAAVAVLGEGDDFVGSNNIRFGDWNDGAEEWLTPPRLIEEPMFSPSPYNVKLDVGDDGEGKYSLYFNVIIFKIDKVLV